MDKLFLKGIRFYAFHGVKEKERREGNIFEVDVEVTLDLGQVIEEDSLEKTINLKDLREAVLRVAKGESYNLLEFLAHKIADEILKSFEKVENVRVNVRKYSPPELEDIDYVGVEISRKRGNRGESPS